ncbi:MAG: ribosome maturation factor RimP [Saprospiraceae bacterium]|nr:ribosome maturation factor RimP [Saprospiraceae bacterium]
MDRDKWQSWLEDRLREIEGGTYFLVDLDWRSSSNRLVVYLDSDEGVTLEACQAISRSLESALDVEGLLGEEYALDVSSPGLDRPLTSLRQYQKNKGRLLNIILKEGLAMKGRLSEVNEESITIEPQVRKGKQKAFSWGQKKEINFSEIEKTFVEVRFK